MEIMKQNNIIDKFLNIKIKEVNTRKSYKNHLSSFCSYLKENNLTLDECKNVDIEHYRNEIMKKFKPSTVNAKLTAIYSLYNFLEKNDYIEVGSADKMKVDYESIDNVYDVYLNNTEIKYLLRYLKNRKRIPDEKCFEFTKSRDLFLVVLAIKTGMRYCELAYLKEENFDLDKMVIYLYTDIRKNDRSLIVPIDNEIKSMYCEYLEIRKKRLSKLKKHEDNIFLSVRGKEFDNTAVNEMIKRNIASANTYYEGVGEKIVIRGDISIHKLRHTSAYLMISNGFTIVETARMLGHTNLRSTERYLHSNIDDIRKKQFNLLD